MEWIELEKRIQRALSGCWRGKKVWVAYPALVLSGCVLTFFRAAAEGVAPWLSLHFLFLSFFLVSTILLALGVLLVRLYALERKGERIDLKQEVVRATSSMGRAAFLATIPLLCSLCLWMTLGLFFLFEAIPILGSVLSVVAAGIPFLLFFATLLLCVTNGFLLFFIPPIAEQGGISFTQETLLPKRIREKPLTSFLLLSIGTLPVLLIVFLLYKALCLTESSFPMGASHPLLMALQGLFVMPLLAALFTPAVLFFFNFSLESYSLLRVQKT